MLTSDGWKLAKDISVSDKLITKAYESIPSVYNEDIYNWSIQEIGEQKTQESLITNIDITDANTSVQLNKQPFARFSLNEDIIVWREGKYQYSKAKDLRINDAALTEHETKTMEIVDIDIIEENVKLHQYTVEPFGLLITRSVLVDHRHN